MKDRAILIARAELAPRRIQGSTFIGITLQKAVLLAIAATEHERTRTEDIAELAGCGYDRACLVIKLLISLGLVEVWRARTNRMPDHRRICWDRLANAGSELPPIPMSSNPHPTIERVMYAACSVCNVTIEDLMSRRRPVQVVLARAVTMIAARRLTLLGWPQLAKAMGRSTHSALYMTMKAYAKRLDLPAGAPGRVVKIDGREVDFGALIESVLLVAKPPATQQRKVA